MCNVGSNFFVWTLIQEKCRMSGFALTTLTTVLGYTNVYHVPMCVTYK